MSMSDLLKDIIAENAIPKTACRVRVIAESLPSGDKDAFMDAVNNENITAPAIERALKKNGYSVASTTIRRHRRLECSCGEPG